jgi:hypothetical protein
MNTLHIFVSLSLVMLTATTPDTSVQLLDVESSENLVEWRTEKTYFAKGARTFKAPSGGHFFRLKSRCAMPARPVVIQIGDSNTGSLAIPWRYAWDQYLKDDAFALFDGDYMARNGELLVTFWARLTGTYEPWGIPNQALNTGAKFDFGPLEADGSPTWDPWPLYNGTTDGRAVNVVIFQLMTNDFNHPSRRESFWSWNQATQEWDIIQQVDSLPGETRPEIWFRKVMHWLHDDVGAFIILRMPPPYTRHPANGFGAGIPEGVKGDKEVKLINDTLRRAYVNAANDPTLPNVMFFDTWEFVFGWPNGERPADWDATSNADQIPEMRDNLHYAEPIQALLAQELNRRLSP